MSDIYIELMEFGEMQQEKVNNDDFKDLIYFESNGNDIVDPFVDESGRFEVNPEEYYGSENWNNWKNKVLKKLGYNF